MKSNIKNNCNIVKENKSNEILFNSNPKDIRFLSDIVKDCYYNYFDNIFCVFNSINDILYLVYLVKNDKTNSIVTYHMIENKKINEIKNAHSELITNLRHYSDKINKRDLIISISSKNNNIKLWNINIFECLLNLENINNNGLLFSACFFNNNNQIYIITSNYCYQGPELIKIFDINGNKIKEIKDSNENTFFIDTYYDNELSKNYIITANKNNCKSYEYEENKVYHIYDNKDIRNHNSAIITKNEGIVKLIESSATGRIRIWNFHTGQIIRTIMVKRFTQVFGLCLWNNEFFFAGCSDKKIKLININRARVFDELSGHNSDVLTIKKIIHPQYGECLISNSDAIKLWKIKN